jgi:hypothetical protein
LFGKSLIPSLFLRSVLTESQTDLIVMLRGFQDGTYNSNNFHAKMTELGANNKTRDLLSEGSENSGKHHLENSGNLHALAHRVASMSATSMERPLDALTRVLRADTQRLQQDHTKLHQKVDVLGQQMQGVCVAIDKLAAFVMVEQSRGLPHRHITSPDAANLNALPYSLVESSLATLADDLLSPQPSPRRSMVRGICYLRCYLLKLTPSSRLQTFSNIRLQTFSQYVFFERSIDVPS